ncbi:TPA: pentapeptide repeat-containing protein [Pasteurella multocida]|uniref:pentapeptide repeat-containing protein n=1 Tax=Pasteurella multocida TaxID=747 RepID=UPI0020240AA2|nr:pentapeptide repeat-containing protein [Pasteurella multocida]URK02407.1 pentapeptide repeat-containing protein [Pasteurella multocida]HDR1859718.1 pentapeptide repeat-containing protein [Pasteurella multocida]
MINWKCLIKAAFIEKFKKHKANLFSKPNEEQVFIIGLSSFVFAIIVITLFIWLLPENLEGINGIWTLITAVISSPILYAIWRLRDQNATKQIENQRKDINLKEFQKIAEWVSGLHLIEDEVTEKIANQTEQETTRKYTQQVENLSIPTFSKKDGAVGLQIAAIYNLLPFYRGEHGESFKKPALNLLLSAWLALQTKESNYLSFNKDSDYIDNAIIDIQIKSNSYIGIAITSVLFSDGGKYLLEHLKLVPNLYLPGVNFNLPSLDKSILKLFNSVNCEGINLVGSQLNDIDVSRVNFSDAKLVGASFEEANFYNIKFNKAYLQKARFLKSYLNNVSFHHSKLYEANFMGAILNKVNFEYAKSDHALFNNAEIKNSDLSGAQLECADLSGVTLSDVVMKNCNLKNARMFHTKFVNCNLEGSNLIGVDLSTVDFVNCNTNYLYHSYIK